MNGRLDTIQAAVLIEKLKIFPDEIVARAARRASATRRRWPTSRPCRASPHGSTSVWAQYTHPPAGRPARRACRRAQGAGHSDRDLLSQAGAPPGRLPAVSGRRGRHAGDRTARRTRSSACRCTPISTSRRRTASSTRCGARWPNSRGRRSDLVPRHGRTCSGHPGSTLRHDSLRRGCAGTGLGHARCNRPGPCSDASSPSAASRCSRALTGFVRDIMLAAMLGAGPVADAFFVALRLPNHFRAIFAEGAFNAAFVPAYARIRAAAAERTPAKLFADRIFTLLFASQVVLLAVALLFTPGVIDLLAPGFAEDPGPLRARGRTHPHHVSLSAAGLAGDALRRHPQRARALRRAGGGADPAQPVDDGDAGARRVLSDRRAMPRPGAC